MHTVYTYILLLYYFLQIFRFFMSNVCNFFFIIIFLYFCLTHSYLLIFSIKDSDVGQRPGGGETRLSQFTETAVQTPQRATENQ